jgi:pimeloyl-ACP methyl ester carboxylesterase
VQLAGSLFLPQGAGPWPAVVLVHGTGPNTRDENAFGHKIFLVLADHLARQGIAVLRYDKRGIGGSTGDYLSATTNDLAGDAQAAGSFLRNRAGIDHRHVGIIGHSEGGMIAPIVAARDPQVAFVVLMAGPGVSGEKLMVEQLAFHAPADKAAQQRAMNQAMLAAVVAESDPEQAQRKAQAILQQGERDGLLQTGVAAAQAKIFTTPWFRTFLALEPATALRAMRQPILALNGELDQQVPAKLDLDAIRTALAGNPHATVMELPKLNHLFQTATTGASAEYASIEETLAPSAMTVITDWICKEVQ